ncbi:crotonase/enoyl-CoA hydratase family protein [Shewanella sp. Scap07]|uniref:crotonase/enoyl-CoA hydratase family protein n=1 Tax=Shewanella sp. Scap07 TaxID=2589987 RepID=UPI0015C0DB6D|nr:crotonase/enoyl-CoA hydratase family protein [Shewanella sp. Scap07]QLE87030.1 crotonase/enoyl-CoA hydratase family protein [Shewanella sp. Scap07]
MTQTLVTLDIHQGLAMVGLNRTDKYNALSFEMFTSIDQTIKQISQRRDVQAVVLFGHGDNFCSGLDVKSVMSSAMQAVKLLFKWLPGNANLAQRVSIGWRRLPVPVICAIDGICYGGGMQIALGCDYRIASPDSQLSVMEAKWGLVPDMAGLVGLRELVGKDQAMLMTMTAAIYSGNEAKALGLVTRVEAAPIEAAKQLATELMRTSPDANAAIKHSINRNWTNSIRRLLSRESRFQIGLLAGKNRVVAAQRQGKHPDKPYKQRQSWW